MSNASVPIQSEALVLPVRPSITSRAALPAVSVVLIAGSFWATLSGGPIVNWGGRTITWRFICAAFAPAHDAEILRLTASSTLTTVAFALCGSAVSLAIGAVVGVLSSDTWWDLWGAGFYAARKYFIWPTYVVRALAAVPRGIHELVWGLFLINVLGLDPLVSVLAIGIPFGVITGKVFAETIDEIPRKTALCFRAAGATTGCAFVYGILPKAFPFLLAYGMYRLECAIRSAAILGLIGAGGLGYQILLSLQSLRYEQVWTFLYALMVLVALTDWGSSKLTRIVRTRTATSYAELAQQTRSLAMAASVVALGIVGAWLYLHLDITKPFQSTRIELLRNVLADSIPPRLARADLPELVTLSVGTLVMSVAGIVMAAIPAIVVSWFSSMSLFRIAQGTTNGSREVRDLVTYALTTIVRIALIAVRALSDGIWVLLALFIFFPGRFAGAFALAAYNFGVIGRILTQVNESADKKPFRALRAQGAPFGRAVLYGFLPLAMPKYLAYILYRWEVCVRATVVVGIVGAGGLGLRLEEQLASFDYRGVAATLLFFVALTLLADFVSAYGRKAIA